MTERIRPPCPDVSAGRGYLRDPISNRPRPGTPEECVRQHVVSWLIKRKGWPARHIHTEYNCRSGGFGRGRIDTALVRPPTPTERQRDVRSVGVFHSVVEWCHATPRLGPTFQEFGNASGGSYPGFYRTFVVDGGRVPLRIHFGLFSVPYEGRVRAGNSKTSLVVAVSDGRRHHNSLQLWVEKYWCQSADFIEVIHDGRLASGRGGAVPRSVVFASVARRAPTLVRDGNVYLGRFSARRRIDWMQARDLLLRLARYALVRDQVRDRARRI
jgi:hypothetical protein